MARTPIAAGPKPVLALGSRRTVFGSPASAGHRSAPFSSPKMLVSLLLRRQPLFLQPPLITRLQKNSLAPGAPRTPPSRYNMDLTAVHKAVFRLALSQGSGPAM